MVVCVKINLSFCLEHNMEDYNFKEIEKKWHERWEKENLFRADNSSNKPKAFCLEMFPYPSGSGLHVGHLKNYIFPEDIPNNFLPRSRGALQPVMPNRQKLC